MRSEKDVRSILGNWDIPDGLVIENAFTRHWKTREVMWQIWDIGGEYFLKTNERPKMIKNMRIAKALDKEGLASEFLSIPTKAGDDYLDGYRV